jgi:hypothetical protein
MNFLFLKIIKIILILQQRFVTIGYNVDNMASCGFPGSVIAYR